MQIADVRSALADALGELGLHTYDYVPDSPIAPAAFIYPDPFNYHLEFGDDAVDARMVVRFLIGSTQMQGGQRQLDTLISPDGPGSAVALLESGDIPNIKSLQVMSMRHYGALALPDGIRYLSAELVLSVYA